MCVQSNYLSCRIPTRLNHGGCWLPLTRPRPANFRKPCGVLSSKLGSPFPYLRAHPRNATWLTFVSRKNDRSAGVASSFPKSVATWGTLRYFHWHSLPAFSHMALDCEAHARRWWRVGFSPSHHQPSPCLTEFCPACRGLLSPHDQQLVIASC